MPVSLLRLLLLTFALTPFTVRLAMAQENSAATKWLDVWIGTSTAHPSRGIYHALLNMETGRLSESTLAAEIRGPGFLAMHPRGTHLYAAGTLNDTPCVAAYLIEGTLGRARLTFINSVEIGDGGAAHLAVDATGSMIVTAQYGGGSTAAFSLNSDGSLKARTALINHEGGANVVGSRQ